MLDLYAQYQSIQDDIDKAISSVIKNSSFIGGKYVEQFEEAMAIYCGTKYAVGLNSGTDALYLALWAYGIGKGDEVITTSFSFFATTEVIVRVNATPVFVDVDPNTFNIDPDLIEKKITKNTKAIIPVHLSGYPAEMNKIMQLAKKYDLIVIEDACQAIGAEYDGKKVGGIGHVGAFSFYPTKNLGGYGDGGLATTNDKKIAEKLKKLRNHGSIVKYHNDEIGVSSRLDAIQAAILTAKLKYIDSWNSSRKKVAHMYDTLLKKIDWLKFPTYSSSTSKNVHHLYTILVQNCKRDELREYLSSNGIASMIYYPIPIHLLGAIKNYGFKKGDLPITEKLTEEVLSLPIYPEITKEQVEFICNLIQKFM